MTFRGTIDVTSEVLRSLSRKWSHDIWRDHRRSEVLSLVLERDRDPEDEEEEKLV